MASENNTKLEEHEYWYENGQLYKQEFYRDGKLEGERKIWYENGQLKIKEYYRNGKFQECWLWNSNGRPWAHGFYRDGKPDGEHKYWNLGGQLLTGEFYRNGKIDSSFNKTKKNGFLRLKQYLKNHAHLFESFMISDLSRIVCL